ncbi:MAG: hypothetical protein UT37_C0001G0004 [Parcubacteria group bacterium GW2011_GWA2_39_18]|nr:MAG: hypothetical protein UT37_C0001G0004 [Parcubacteria group bacterium GW2011_GWA2_39_18]
MNVFFEWCKKNIIWILIALLLATVLIVAFVSRDNKIINNPPLGLGRSESPAIGTTIPPTPYGSELPKTSDFSYLSGTFSPPKNLRDVAKIVSLLTPSIAPLAQNQTLSLPEVVNSEIIFSPQGAKTIDEYVDGLIEIFKGNRFLINPEYARIFKLDSVGLMLPTEIIRQALQKNDKTEMKDALLAWSKLNEDVINEYKKAEINNSAYSVVGFSKMVIGVSKLQGKLIEKGIAYTDGQINSSETQAYLDKFIGTVNFYSKKTAAQLQNALNNKNWFLKTAYAASSLPFGGMIDYVYSCCNGLMLTIGPPGPEGEYMIYWPFLASPLFYQFRATHIGAWLLGLYVTGGTCTTGTYCAVTITTYSIIMTGTSE